MRGPSGYRPRTAGGSKCNTVTIGQYRAAVRCHNAVTMAICTAPTLANLLVGLSQHQSKSDTDSMSIEFLAGNHLPLGMRVPIISISHALRRGSSAGQIGSAVHCQNASQWQTVPLPPWQTFWWGFQQNHSVQNSYRFKVNRVPSREPHPAGHASIHHQHSIRHLGLHCHPRLTLAATPS